MRRELHNQSVDNDLETVATALYVKIGSVESRAD